MSTEQPSASSVRLGVDIGGTFTDTVLEVGQRLFSTKVLTTHDAPDEAILVGLRQVCAQAGIAPSAISQVIHGTTLATNALIERRGAKTALVTTEGFRDVIEMRTESRFEQYDLNLELPEPLLPRERRYTLPERLAADGTVLRPLQRTDVEVLAVRLANAGYRSIAIGFLHAYVDDRHERLVAEVFAERLPGVELSLSSAVSPQMREYERFNTTVANAYIKPLMKRYLQRLSERLAGQGVRCPVFLMHSGGGILSLRDAARFPVRLVESGPAGGAVFAADIAARHGLRRVLSFDMGGTTAKICLIKDARPRTARSFEVARSYRFKKGSGMPISIPVIDMVEIGAGGGSLAWRDALGRIRVGPRSAGSEPGPACYGRGGTQAAVTDADLLLGKLDPESFAGGAFTLDRQAAHDALRRSLGQHGDTGPDTDGATAQAAARGIVEVVDENMANAARVHAVENGEDLADYTMIAFGGAAPLHAARLCEKLGIDRLLVPPGAGVGSAIGFLRAGARFEAVRSAWTKVSALQPEQARAVIDALADEATGFVRACRPDEPVRTRLRAFMRYCGQGWEIPIELDEATLDADTLSTRFEEEYSALFGRTVSGLDIEITLWSVEAATSATAVERVEQVGRAGAGDAVAIAGHRRLFDPAEGGEREAAVVHRDALRPGQRIQGPAVIVEAETSVIVPGGMTALGSADGSLDLTVDDGATRRGEGASEVARQVMWNRLISVVEEQAQALIRTAFSTSVREAGDLSAGVYDARGRMLAQAVTGTPGHVNAMAEAVAHAARRIGLGTLRPGDVIVTNDPWEGTGHLHDFTMMTPVFRSDALIGWFACTAHVVDIGGRGFGADANSLYEEGLQVPTMRFARAGTVDRTLIDIVRANVREPDQLIGDLHALATCNEVGERRLADMLDEFALDDLQELSTFILSRSERATRERIGALSPGSASGSMTIDGFDSPITLNVRLDIEAERIVCDFAGSSPVDEKGINVPMVYTRAYACYALKCAIAPDIPNNSASLAPFEVTAPPGSILNAERPAPVALRHIIGHMVPDAVYTALDVLLPDTVPSEGAGTLCNFQLSLRPVGDGPSGRAEVLTFNSGGAGARPRLDGLSATAFPSGVMTMPVEATEQIGPAVIWRKELRVDSGGAGRQRGGLGQCMEVGAREGHAFDLQAMLDRVHHPARGRAGGGDGAPTTIALDDGTPLAGKGRQQVPRGRTVLFAFPGGGGYGPVHERDALALRRDLIRGYISERAAREDYGMDEARIAQARTLRERGPSEPDEATGASDR